jgi:hypothetical protein
MGGPQDGNASGGPCVRFGDEHWTYAGTSEARNGVALLGRGYPGWTGCQSGRMLEFVVSWVTPDPSGFIVNVCTAPVLVLEKAILVPSGDHAGDWSAAGSVVSLVWSVPSASMT